MREILLQNLLKDFTGVLVSDFYAAYDGIQCPQQKCLIHLIRDLNDAVLEHPYDEQLKSLVKNFADLVKPMVETVDRHGLKASFLEEASRVCRPFLQTDSRARIFRASRQERSKSDSRRIETSYLHFSFTTVCPGTTIMPSTPSKHLRCSGMQSEGVTSEEGHSRTICVLLSISQTCKYKEVDFLDFLRSGEKDINVFANLVK